MLTKHFAFVFICAISIVNGKNAGQVNVLLENYENCEEFPNGKMHFSDIQLRHINRTFVVVDAILEIKEDISEDFHGIAELSKCDSKQQSGTCQWVMKLMLNRICEKVKNSNSSYYLFADAIENFEKSCPLKKGTYVVKDAPIDISGLQKTDLWLGYWQVKGLFYDGKELVLCLDIEVNISKRRFS